MQEEAASESQARPLLEFDQPFMGLKSSHATLTDAQLFELASTDVVVAKLTYDDTTVPSIRGGVADIGECISDAKGLPIGTILICVAGISLVGHGADSAGIADAHRVIFVGLLGAKPAIEDMLDDKPGDRPGTAVHTLSASKEALLERGLAAGGLDHVQTNDKHRPTGPQDPSYWNTIRNFVSGGCYLVFSEYAYFGRQPRKLPQLLEYFPPKESGPGILPYRAKSYHMSVDCQTPAESFRTGLSLLRMILAFGPLHMHAPSHNKIRSQMPNYRAAGWGRDPHSKLRARLLQEVASEVQYDFDDYASRGMYSTTDVNRPVWPPAAQACDPPKIDVREGGAQESFVAEARSAKNKRKRKERRGGGRAADVSPPDDRTYLYLADCDNNNNNGGGGGGGGISVLGPVSFKDIVEKIEIGELQSISQISVFDWGGRCKGTRGGCFNSIHSFAEFRGMFDRQTER